ncbi:hypothetical protein JCM6882_004548 [Rhodosporidiobolus microsporus]
MSTPGSTPSSLPPLDLPLPLPFPLPALLSFALSNPFTQSLTTSAANRFFVDSHPPPSPSPSSSAGAGPGAREPFVQVREGGEDVRGCWGLLPGEWREWFDAVSPTEDGRMGVLKDLANGSREDFPPSLQAYLNSCRALSLDRSCSWDPVLSYPPRPSSSSPSSPAAPPPANEPQEREKAKAKGKGKAEGKRKKERVQGVKGPNVKNALKAGQSDKKEHEVRQLSRLVQDLKAESPLTHCIDVGSGRAHLSRALSCPPLNLHTLALDWSSSQAAGAAKLDAIRTKADLGPTEGSLTHEVESLDEEGVRSAMGRWPPPPASPREGEEVERPPPALLVALHACGDLTPSSLRAFVRADVEDPSRRTGAGARAVFVGCCYNMMDPGGWPMSRLVGEACSSSLSSSSSSSPAPAPLPPRITLSHLRLTPQSPPTWHLSPSSTSSFLASTLKIAFRARLEAELAAAGVGAEDERRVGRVAECGSWGEYRRKGLSKYDYGREDLSEGEKVPELRFGAREGQEEEEWQRALWQLRVFWTLRSWLGPVMETLCVVDRFAFLCEGLRHEWEAEEGGQEEEKKQKKRRVEVVNVFDQATGSLRNLALVVR